MRTKISLSFLAITGILVGAETAPAKIALSNVQNLVAVTEVNNPHHPGLINYGIQQTSQNSQGLYFTQTNVSISDVADFGNSTKISANPAEVQSETSIEIFVPPPRTQTIKVKPVTRLPKATVITTVNPVNTIPSVRPAAANSQSNPVAFIDNGVNESNSELIYPLATPAPITSRFGWRTHPLSGSRRFHSGVDLGAPMGAPVIAAGSGTIVSAGWNGGYGKAIIIQHNGIQQTLYGHLSDIFVQPGQSIERGTVIGRVGSTGQSTGPHLHFESRMSTSDGWATVDPGEDIQYALDNLRRTMPFAKRDLPPGVN